MKQILFVIGKGGPALEYALPKLAAQGNIHALIIAPISDFNQKEVIKHCDSIKQTTLETTLRGNEMVEQIVSAAKEINADAIITFSEFAIWAVAESCKQLGLRGPGLNVANARDKLKMRMRWLETGVPGPNFRGVTSEVDLHKAFLELEKPFLLKPTLSAGSVGQYIIDYDTNLEEVWNTLVEEVNNTASTGAVEYMDDEDINRFIAEEIIKSSTESWYEEPGYGDYLSVEGIVVDGQYYPICITSRLPTIPPFIEVSNQAPCVLAEDKQRKIEEIARKAVDTLGLETAGTHTEIKLMPDGELCLIETAARLPGAMVIREVEEAFGIDLIGLLAQALMGEKVELPSRMLVTGAKKAAATVAFIAANSRGESWSSSPVFDSEKIDWTKLVSPGTKVEVIEGVTIANGSPVPKFDLVAGALNFSGLFFVTATDPLTLKRDTYSLLDNLELVLGEKIK